ncbi:membrane protein [Paenibacillus darwinianus]|uniref:BMP family ABC transporter substrate-binding protein n=1 Tax=Paenibacillus darwinianus TaxID=1380763 RepID=UPI00045196FA|nr:BMP family ABC transporter substrate-binding protein [Paenibacillus darwinianus]EXX88599.1 membrane protein [Paenibacillus darwinianus]
MRHRSKKWALATVLALSIVLVIGGCGNNGVNGGGEPEGGSETKADSGGSNAASGAGMDKPRVAFVYIGPPGDGGWTSEHDKGRKYMEEKLGIKADTVENVPESADAERVITELAQNHDIIFTTSFGYMDPTLNVAKKFPNVKFMHVSGYKTSDNMGTYFGKNFEASYLSGIAAGKMTKADHIGYVGAFPIPEVIYNINAFTLGIQSVNPDAKVSVVWSNTWFDPTVERQAAVSLLDKGADVLLAYQDSPATLQAAAERGAMAGGNDSDMTRYAPEAYLTNPVWVWGPFYTKVVQSVMDGTWTNEPYMGSMAEGLVDIAPLGPSVPDDVKELVAAKKQEILDGKLEVFKGPLLDQSGAAKVAEGQSMPLEEILGMNWFVKGVEGSIPQ